MIKAGRKYCKLLRYQDEECACYACRMVGWTYAKLVVGTCYPYDFKAPSVGNLHGVYHIYSEGVITPVEPEEFQSHFLDVGQLRVQKLTRILS